MSRYYSSSCSAKLATCTFTRVQATVDAATQEVSAGSRFALTTPTNVFAALTTDCVSNVCLSFTATMYNTGSAMGKFAVQANVSVYNAVANTLVYSCPTQPCASLGVGVYVPLSMTTNLQLLPGTYRFELLISYFADGSDEPSTTVTFSNVLLTAVAMPAACLL